RSWSRLAPGVHDLYRNRTQINLEIFSARVQLVQGCTGCSWIRHLWHLWRMLAFGYRVCFAPMLLGERFEVATLIGRGGMGQGYRARDLAAGADVAVKVLPLDGTDLSERFAREARLLCAVDHPRIVRYIAHGVSQGQRYLAMEWIAGEDLAAR